MIGNKNLQINSRIISYPPGQLIFLFIYRYISIRLVSYPPKKGCHLFLFTNFGRVIDLLCLLLNFYSTPCTIKYYHYICSAYG